jgi:hypothetical protein
MYPSNLNASEIKQQVSLVDLLTSLGHEPAKRAGRELIYISMLRDTDTKPSFSVNKELNVWYDHGTAKGGNIIDFAMAYWKLTFIEALKKIASVSNWEVRNLYFKGCLGHKAITFISRDETRVAVFEGCFNYLSWLTENPFSSDSILVLNSATLLESAIRKAKDFLEISVYFDRDYIGRQACADFIRALPQAVDQSVRYKDFNDYNDMLVYKTKKVRKVSRGM